MAKATSNRMFGPLLAFCIAVGITAGSAIWKVTPADSAVSTNTHGPVRDVRVPIQKPVPAEKARVLLGNVRELHLADVMLTHGNVAQALDRYAKMEPLSGRLDLHDQLLYRICVAHEMLAQDEVAIELYGQLAGQGSNPIIRILAKLGKARIWLQSGRRQLARVVLADAVLDDFDDLPSRSSIGGEIYHLMGLSFFSRPDDREENMLLNNVAASLLPSWTATDLLKFAEVAWSYEESSRDPAKPKSSGSVVSLVYRYGSDPSEIQLDAHLAKAPITFQLEKLATAAQLSVGWSDSAAKLAKGRETALDSSSTNFAVLLDTFLAKYDLVWTVSNEEIKVFGRLEFSGMDLRRIENAAAHRVLQHAVTVYPEHAIAFYSHFVLANLRFESKDFASAASMYRHCIERFPRSQGTAAAEFNLAKALLNAGERAEALKMFFQVGDSAHGHPLQSPTNAYAGRLLLEDGKIRDAVRPLMRAMSTAVEPRDRSRSTALLAAAYLLADNAHAAAQVLMESKQELHDDETVSSLAAFLNAYSQFKVADDSLGASQSGRNLINSLSDLHASLELDGFWHLLMGYALRDIGLPNQMVATFASRMKREQTSWIREQMHNELVKYWMENKDFPALKSFLATASDPKQLTELAAVNFYEGRIDECIAVCHDLLVDNSENDNLHEDVKLSCLQLLGRAYQSQGSHFKAALCFAGMLPMDPVDQLQQPVHAMPNQ